MCPHARLFVLLLAASALEACSSLPPAVTDSEGRPQSDPSTLSAEELAQLQQKMVLAAQPGPEHEMLAKYAGAWKLQTTMWPSRGAEPIRIESTARAEMVLGGRFLMSRGTSEWMGTQAETLSMTGFDRRSGEFTLEAFDTMGTYSVGGRGPMSPDGTSATLHGTDYDAIGRLTQEYDFVYTWIDDDTFRVEIVFHDPFHAPGGEPFKMVEVLNTRIR